MLDRDLIKHLQSLQHVRPSGAWQERTKAALLARMAKAQEPLGVSPFMWYDVFRFATTFKSVRLVVSQATIVAVVAGSVLGGGIANSFAEDSLPGDTLYPVKIAMEQAKVSLTSGTENKVKAQSKLAEKRLNEVKKVAKKPATKKSPAVVAQAIQEFKDQVKVVEKGLEQVKQEVAAPAAAETAKEVGENVKELQKTLEQTKEGATQEVKQDLQKAEVAVSDTATKALEVLVEKQSQAPEIVSKEEVATLVQDKITTTQAKLEAAVVVSDAADKANTDAGITATSSGINDACAVPKVVPNGAPSPQPSPSGGEGVISLPRLSLEGRGPAVGGGEGDVPVPTPATPPVSCAKEKLNDAQKSLATNDLSKALESTKQADKIVQAVVEKQAVGPTTNAAVLLEKSQIPNPPLPVPATPASTSTPAAPAPQGSSLQGKVEPSKVEPVPAPTSAPAPKPTSSTN